jgi:MATE family multidrug resistance protein
MFISIGGLALDVTLNWLLIFGNAGFPKMGINAIALNTGITHVVMSLALLLVLWKQKELAYFRSARSSWKAIWNHTLHFIRQGIPSALQMVVEFSAFGAGTILIGQISKTEQAAHQIAINLISLTYVTIMGVSTAGMIRIGQALAYQNKARIVLAGLGTVLLGILIMLLPTVVFLFAPGTVVGWYMEDATVVQIATSLVFMAGLFQMADAAQATSISLLRALNDIKIPALISFIAFWLIGLPLGYWLAMKQNWNAQGIWVGYLVALLIQASWFVYRFFQLIRTRTTF